MHHVTKFVEEGDHFVVLHERWDISLWRIEVGDHRDGGPLDFAIDLSPLQKRKSCSMVELIWSWVQVEVKLPKKII